MVKDKNGYLVNDSSFFNATGGGQKIKIVNDKNGYSSADGSIYDASQITRTCSFDNAAEQVQCLQELRADYDIIIAANKEALASTDSASYTYSKELIAARDGAQSAGSADPNKYGLFRGVSKPVSELQRMLTQTNSDITLREKRIKDAETYQKNVIDTKIAALKKSPIYNQQLQKLQTEQDAAKQKVVVKWGVIIGVPLLLITGIIVFVKTRKKANA